MLASYMNRTIEDGVTDADAQPRVLNLCVSVGEFEPMQTILEISDSGTYEMVCLDFAALCSLKVACEDALRIHTEFAQREE
jgi:hypothetical protein